MMPQTTEPRHPTVIHAFSPAFPFNTSQLLKKFCLDCAFYTPKPECLRISYLRGEFRFDVDNKGADYTRERLTIKCGMHMPRPLICVVCGVELSEADLRGGDWEQCTRCDEIMHHVCAYRSKSWELEGWSSLVEWFCSRACFVRWNLGDAGTMKLVS